jgi:hypothetical protein
LSLQIHQSQSLFHFKKEVKSHKYEWSTRDNRKLQTTVAVDAADSATTMVVTDPGVFNVDDVFQMPGGAQFVVESVAGGVNVTFRKIAGTLSRKITTHRGRNLSIRVNVRMRKGAPGNQFYTASSLFSRGI